ncbi:1-deoxy-D-xylulose-5-phosphate reductoisomerase [Litoribacillus peritrichatus]|uniref:1-deoxy-D-xylulose 5-phosphate reductoisomerase n=1 Tax=Litoribacillus peritrichatus TaxID=718191 RepID=A0ABP7N971_9GAMM
MHSPQQITILGATGSIGLSTLDVVKRHSDRFNVFALSAFSRVDELAALCQQYLPVYAVVADEASARKLTHLLDGLDTQVLFGSESLAYIASHESVDVVMAAIVGAAGLLPNLAAAKAGKRVLLANKESLVMSGQIFMETVEQSGAVLLPIDSEHNAIFQCLPNGRFDQHTGVEKILLTASGGPFRQFTLDQLNSVTPAQAVAHPNWSMGQKISVDSASLMNKGLELIEACWLFHCSADQVQVVVHPESVIHSMVSYVDGSVIAQMGNPDMRTPIAYGLAWPERLASGVESLDLFEVAQLNFEKPDLVRFPCLKHAMESFRVGGIAPAVLNASNEIAVSSFLSKKIAFMDIPRVVEGTLNEIENRNVDSLDSILEADSLARTVSKKQIEKLDGR